MTDINQQLQESYYSLLFGSVKLNAVDVPVYYAQMPVGANVDNYILINSISSTGFNTECNNMTTTTVQLMVVTKAMQNNSGEDCNNISGQVQEIIIPGPRAKAVQIDNGQVISTDMNLDVVRTGLTDGVKKIVQRIISFQHTISVN